MKVRDMFTHEFVEKYGDVDVCNDVTDDMAPAFCGPLLLTEAGEERFGNVLDLKVEMIETQYFYAEVKIEDLCGCEEDELETWDQVVSLFSAAAGYCADDLWSKWFKEV